MAQLRLTASCQPELFVEHETGWASLTWHRRRRVEDCSEEFELEMMRSLNLTRSVEGFDGGCLRASMPASSGRPE